MTLVRWDPFRDLVNLHQRMSSQFAGTNDAYGTWVPPVDIFEKGDDLVIRAELPGLSKEEIDISVEDNRLVIKGERVRETDFNEDNAYRLERSFGSFVRSFMLPKTVDASKIAATFVNGVLELTLPKAEAAKPRKVEIAVS
jgi:HSP20 family protein